MSLPRIKVFLSGVGGTLNTCEFFGVVETNTDTGSISISGWLHLAKSKVFWFASISLSHGGLRFSPLSWGRLRSRLWISWRPKDCWKTMIFGYFLSVFCPLCSTQPSQQEQQLQLQQLPTISRVEKQPVQYANSQGTYIYKWIVQHVSWKFKYMVCWEFLHRSQPQVVKVPQPLLYIQDIFGCQEQNKRRTNYVGWFWMHFVVLHEILKLH